MTEAIFDKKFSCHAVLIQLTSYIYNKHRGSRFNTYTAAGHQGDNELIWLHLRRYRLSTVSGLIWLVLHNP